MQVGSKNSAQIDNIRDNIVPVLPILDVPQCMISPTSDQ